MSSLHQKPQSKNWAITTIKVIETSLTWSVQNFSYNMKKLGESVESPIFTEENGFKWCMVLYPNGESDPDFVSLYLNLKNSASSENNMIKYQFSILNHRGEIAHQIKWSELCEIEPGSAWGYEKFFAKTKLFRESANFLPNDTLTILCEVKMSEGIKEKSGCENNVDLTNYYKPETDLSTDLQKLWKKSLFSDIVLLSKDKKFLAHKSILSARSSYFAELLKFTNANVVNIETIDVKDYNGDVMEEILRYIYTSKAENLQIHGETLLMAAKKFNLPGLEHVCENYFIKGLNVINCASTLILADCHKVQRLKEFSLDFIVLNSKDVFETAGYRFLKLTNQNLMTEIYNRMDEKFSSSNDSKRKHKKSKKKSRSRSRSRSPSRR